MADSNIAFYQNIDLEIFRSMCVNSGLDSNPELELIYPLIKDKASIMEIGVGFGRTIDFLIEKDYQGLIYAVDRIQNFIDHTKSKFGSRVKTILKDVRELHTEKKVDVILWLWSGILELEFDDQKKVINTLKDTLNEDGILFVEAPKDKIKVHGKKLDKNNIRYETPWGTINAYLAYEDDFRTIARECGYTSFKTIEYRTSVDLERIIYCFYK